MFAFDGFMPSLTPEGLPETRRSPTRAGGKRSGDPREGGGRPEVSAPICGSATQVPKVRQSQKSRRVGRPWMLWMLWML